MSTLPAAAASHSSAWVWPSVAAVGAVRAGRTGTKASGWDQTSTPEVVHAGRQRLGEPHRPAGAGPWPATGIAVGAAGPAGERCRAADDGVGVVVLGDDEADRPRGPEQHRAQPVRGQVDPDRLAALEVVLLGEQRRGLGDPVGVRRDRQLGALAAGVVVERDQRAAGVAAQARPGRRRRWSSRPAVGCPADPCAVGPLRCGHACHRHFWAVIPAGGAGTRLWPLSRSASPKFLHDLTGSGRSLLQRTVDRLAPLVEERVLVVTGAGAPGGRGRASCPSSPDAAVMAEPSPRDSMAAIGLAAAVLERRDPRRP